MMVVKCVLKKKILVMNRKVDIAKVKASEIEDRSKEITLNAAQGIRKWKI